MGLTAVPQASGFLSLFALPGPYFLPSPLCKVFRLQLPHCVPPSKTLTALTSVFSKHSLHGLVKGTCFCFPPFLSSLKARAIYSWLSFHCWWKHPPHCTPRPEPLAPRSTAHLTGPSFHERKKSDQNMSSKIFLLTYTLSCGPWDLLHL